MSKMLLINPSPNAYRKIPEVTGTNFGDSCMPMGIIAVAQYYREKGYDVEIFDSRLYSSDEMQQILPGKLKSADEIGITVNTYLIHEAIIISEKAKKLHKKVIWGGIHPKLYPEQCKEIADEVCVADLNPKSFLGAYDLLEIEKYINRIHFDGEKYRILDIIVTRGCPHRCAFCINPLFKKRYYYIPPVAVVNKNLRKLITTYNLNHINFFDENFFVNLSFAKSIIENLPDGITFTALCRANYFKRFDEDMKKLLKEKCIMLIIGMESGSQRVLDFIKKDITIADIRLANEMCKELEIIADFSLMIGIPTETIEEMKETVKLSVELKKRNPSSILGVPRAFRPYPGCELYNYLKEDNLLQVPESVYDWIKFYYNEGMPWLDKKTKAFMDDVLFYMAKSNSTKNNIKDIGLKKVSLFRLNNGFYEFGIERRIVSSLYKNLKARKLQKKKSF